MKRLMTLAIAAGALAGMQALAAAPAEAGGWCGHYGYSYYRTACCPGYYGAVYRYRPAVRRVVYYRVVDYRPVRVRHWRRGCC